jgi:predicted amidohydrolase
MKIALASNLVTSNIDRNFKEIISMCHQAAADGAGLILFPEAALTGLINNDDPCHDLPIGRELSDPIVRTLIRHSSILNIWIAIGFLERKEHCLYDSAILINRSGRIPLHHRRINPRWHGAKADPSTYRQGNFIKTANTPFGKLAFLICGDLFDDTVVSQLQGRDIDYLLFPFARCFDDKAIDQERWDGYELLEYRDRIRKIGIPTLMVNYLAGDDLDDDGSFGGAFAIAGDGGLISNMPLGKPGIMIIDLPIRQAV